MTQPVYVAANPVEAEIVRQLLASHGIRTELLGVFAWGAVGELPLPEAWPRLYLVEERDRERARAVIRDYESAPVAGSWACRQCGERSPAHFGACWSCGARHPL
jgi:hypothetical protein